MLRLLTFLFYYFPETKPRQCKQNISEAISLQKFLNLPLLIKSAAFRSDYRFKKKVIKGNNLGRVLNNLCSSKKAKSSNFELAVRPSASVLFSKSKLPRAYRRIHDKYHWKGKRFPQKFCKYLFRRFLSPEKFMVSY